MAIDVINSMSGREYYVEILTHELYALSQVVKDANDIYETFTIPAGIDKKLLGSVGLTKDIVSMGDFLHMEDELLSIMGIPKKLRQWNHLFVN